ncbi:hypothetical protein C0580_03965 [Candidatus Parcubacteria bacterium]|nr:MAG: hypothetical protein C0580_03965 [Candidatus Parcubacteria bacterium]
MTRQDLADLMAWLICLAAVFMILSDGHMTIKSSTPIPIDTNQTSKYPIARIEMTMEKLSRLLNWDKLPLAPKITS